MPNHTSPARSTGPGSSRSLTDRVSDRVAEASLALDRRAGASRPKSSRARRARADNPALSAAGTPESLRAARSLRRVFSELGDTYRSYRRRTGQPVLPPLRDAANAFKRDPNLTSLVTVAAFLDDLAILAW